MNPPRTLFRRSNGAALLWALVGGAACTVVIPLEPNMLEEGVVVHIAQRLLRGERLYQDVLAFTGPLPFEALALLFRLFGEEIVVGRLAIVALHGMACGATFALAQRAKAGPFAHAAAAVTASAPLLLFPLYSIFYYTTLAFSLSVLAAYSALRGVRATGWAFAAGVLVAAAALCKQTVGVLLAATLLVALAGCSAPGQRLRRGLAFASGGVAVAVITLSAFAWSGGLDELVHSLVLLPLSFEETYRAPYVNFWPPGRFDPDIEKSDEFYLPYFWTLKYGVFKDSGWPITLLAQILYALPLVALAGTALRRLPRPLPAAVWLHFALLASWMSNLFPRTDWGHLVHVLPSSAVQILLLLGIPRRRPARLPHAAQATAVLIVLALAGGAGWAGAFLYRIANPPAYGPRVPQRPVSPGLRGDTVPGVIRYLREHAEPGEAIFVARAEPLLYFATDTRNPTPYSGVVPGMREEQQRVILEALEQLRYVVMSEIDQPAMTYYRDVLPDVQTYLERYFHRPTDFPNRWIVVLERGADRGETVTDLFDVRASARPWIRDRRGRELPAAPFTDPLPTKYNRRPVGFRLGAGGGGLDFEVDVPENAVFQGDVGLCGLIGLQDWYRHPRRSVLRVSVGRAGELEVLSETRACGPGLDPDRWTPVEVDLARYAGQRVTLRLELASRFRLRPGRISWWGSPRVAIRP
ncbi:MAG: hypothetical protein V3T07_09045 [Myxococcota bacterium]